MRSSTCLLFIIAKLAGIGCLITLFLGYSAFAGVLLILDALLILGLVIGLSYALMAES